MTRHRLPRTLATLCLACVPLVIAGSAQAHCEIPCGIYGDRMRIDMIAEDIATLEKSIQEINALSAHETKNDNQIVRWVQNKEVHADRISHTVTQYFMTQRLEPANPEHKKEQEPYLKKLTLLHKMLLHAMKAKQTTDLKHVEELRRLLDAFDKAYFGTHSH
jgi:nickel superoxide dismutase